MRQSRADQINREQYVENNYDLAEDEKHSYWQENNANLEFVIHNKLEENENVGIVSPQTAEQQHSVRNNNADDNGQSIPSSRFYVATAFQLLQRLTSRVPIVTLSKSLDQLLGEFQVEGCASE